MQTERATCVARFAVHHLRCSENEMDEGQVIAVAAEQMAFAAEEMIREVGRRDTYEKAVALIGGEGRLWEVICGPQGSEA